MTLQIPINMIDIIREQCPSVDIEVVSNKKIQFDQFNKLTDEMLEYCDQDVNLTHRLFTFLKSRTNFPESSIIELEQRVKSILVEQQAYGFYFDVENANKLATELKFKKLSLEMNLQRIFRPLLLPDGPIKTTNKLIKRRQYIPSTTQFKGW